MIQEHQTVLDSIKQHINIYPSGSQMTNRKQDPKDAKEETKCIIHTRGREEKYSEFLVYRIYGTCTIGRPTYRIESISRSRGCFLSCRCCDPRDLEPQPFTSSPSSILNPEWYMYALLLVTKKVFPFGSSSPHDHVTSSIGVYMS